MIGEKIRHARHGQQRSLADVAGKAKISVATLSRIENEKQSIDLGLFLVIARILRMAPHELLGEDGDGANDDNADPLVQRIAAQNSTERTQLWRELAAERRAARGRSRITRVRNLAMDVEELLAQVDFMREELEAVRSRVGRTR